MFTGAAFRRSSAGLAALLWLALPALFTLSSSLARAQARLSFADASPPAQKAGSPAAGVISLGTSREKVDVLLGRPLIASTINCLGRTLCTYADGTKVIFVNGRAVWAAASGQATATTNHGAAVEHAGQQVLLEPVILCGASEGPPLSESKQQTEESFNFAPPAFPGAPFPGGVARQHASTDNGEADCPDDWPGHERKTGWLTGVYVGAGTWISWGQSATSFRIGAVNVASELKWRNLVSEALDLNAGAVFWNRLVVNAEVDVGAINSGHLIDDDYLLPDRQGLFSQSSSPAPSDQIHAFIFDLGWRFFDAPHLTIDGLVGYLYWRERYVTNGGTQVFSALGFPVPAGSIFPPGPGITEQYTWQGLRVGAQSVLDLTPRLTIKSRVVLLPVTRFENDDVHYARVPLLTSADRATGGFGVMADVGVAYRLWRSLSLEVGYRIWALESGKGEISESVGGTAANLPFNRGSTTRQGLTLGLSYQF